MPSRPYDVVVALSRSGTTTEVAHALDAVGAVAHRGHHRGAGLAGRASQPTTSSRSSSPTSGRSCRPRFATTALQPAARATRASTSGPRWPTRARRSTRSLPVPPGEADRWAFLGRGWTVGLASEAALKLREVGPGVDRGLPGLRVPPRADQRRRRGHRGLGVRRGASRVAWRRGRNRRHVRRRRPARGPRAGAGAGPGTGQAAGLDLDRPRHLARVVHLLAAGDAAQPGGQASEQSMRSSGTS